MIKPTLIFATFLSTHHHKTYQYVMDAIERLTNIPTFLLCGESLDDFADGYIDGGFISGLAYLQFSKQAHPPVDLTWMPTHMDKPYPQMHSSFLEVVVRKDSQFRTMNDFHRSVWAYHQKISLAGYRFVPAPPLLQADKCINAVIGGFVETRSHAQSLHQLLEGHVDAAVIDSAVLDLVLHNSPQLSDQLYVLDSFGPDLLPPVVVSSHVDPVVKRALQVAFRTIVQDPFLIKQLQADYMQSLFYSPARRVVTDACQDIVALHSRPLCDTLLPLPDFVY